MISSFVWTNSWLADTWSLVLYAYIFSVLHICRSVFLLVFLLVLFISSVYVLFIWDVCTYLYNWICTIEACNSDIIIITTYDICNNNGSDPRLDNMLQINNQKQLLNF